MKTKLIVLALSIFGLLLNIVLYSPRYFGLCQETCSSYIDKYQDMTMIFPFLLFFSVVTFLLKSEIFIIWWRYTKVALPIILLLSYVVSLELHHSPSGFMNFDHAIDYYFYQILNLVYIAGSLIAIYRGYRQSKMGGKGGAAAAAVDARRVI